MNFCITPLRDCKRAVADILRAPRARPRTAGAHQQWIARYGAERDGAVDLEIGTFGLPAPEVRTRLLFRDNFVGAIRARHLMLSGPVTPEHYAACGHVVASRKEEFTGPVDDALAALGLKRRIVAVVPGFPDALQVARGTDLVALVPRSCLRGAPGLARPIPGD